jgi:hypothetical protein
MAPSECLEISIAPKLVDLYSWLSLREPGSGNVGITIASTFTSVISYCLLLHRYQPINGTWSHTSWFVIWGKAAYSPRNGTALCRWNYR